MKKNYDDIQPTLWEKIGILILVAIFLIVSKIDYLTMIELSNL